MKKIFLNIFIIFILLFFQNIAFSAISDNGNFITVKAVGIGATKMEALKSAWAEAVHQGVGLYMASKSQVINDNLTENIIAHSRGKVDSYKEISANQTPNGWNVEIEAKIEKRLLIKTASSISDTPMQEISFDGSNVAARINTSKNEKKTSEQLFEDFTLNYKLEDLLIHKASIKNSISPKGKNGILVTHMLCFDPKKFEKIIIPQLTELLDQISESKKINMFHFVNNTHGDAFKSKYIEFNKKISNIKLNKLDINYDIDYNDIYKSYKDFMSRITRFNRRTDCVLFLNKNEYIVYSINKKNFMLSNKIKNEFNLNLFIKYIYNGEEEICSINKRIKLFDKYNSGILVISPSMYLDGDQAYTIAIIKQFIEMSDDELASVKSFKCGFKVN